MLRLFLTLSLAALPVAAFAAEPAAEPAVQVPAAPLPVALQKIVGGYAIVVSEKTLADKDWAQVVETLKQKYGAAAKVIVWKHQVEEARAQLAQFHPHYTCFVARPEKAPRMFVARVHRLCRGLNNDPYPDTIWGILTGATAGDALRIAFTCAPLVIRTAVSTTGVNTALYDEVFTLSDGEKGHVTAIGEKAKGIAYSKGPEGDRAKAVVDALNTMEPGLIVTSSHACENILEMPFSHGAILGQAGQAVGVTTQGGHGGLSIGPERFAIQASAPKIWLASGNCLAGRIKDGNSIALGMMHSAGVTQMVGYTVPTWYGAAGWGTLEWFQGQPGRFSAMEAAFINDVAMTRRLAKEFPGKESFAVKSYGSECDFDQTLGGIADALGVNEHASGEKGKNLLGLTWDHDTLAVYGDPAWDARIAPHACGFAQKVSDDGKTQTFEVTADKDGGVTAFTFLPRRIEAAAHKAQGQAKDILLTDSYLLVDFGEMKQGETRKIAVAGK